MEQSIKVQPAVVAPHGQEIAISAFPESVRAALSAFDNDGSGFISPDELAYGAKLFVEAKASNKKMKKTIIGLSITMILCSFPRGVTCSHARASALSLTAAHPPPSTPTHPPQTASSRSASWLGPRFT